MGLFGGGGIGGLGGGMGMVSGLFGGGGGGDLNKLLQQMKRQQALRYTQAQSYQLQGLDQLRGGYDEAIKNVGRTGLASKMGIESAGQRSQGAIQQSFTNRGLSNSTAMAASQGLASGQTAQALAGVDSAVAAAKAGLLTSKGNAQNAAYMGLSGLSQNYSQAEMGLGGMAWNNLSSQPSEYQMLMQLFGTVGQFLPMAVA